jgi:hypothetical protein
LSAPDKRSAYIGISGREEDGDGTKDHHHHQAQDDEHIAPSGGRWIPKVLKGVRDNVSANLSEPKIGIPNSAARRSFGFVWYTIGCG